MRFNFWRYSNTFNQFLESRSRYVKGVFTKPKKGTKEAKEFNEQMSFNAKAREKVKAMSKNIELNTPRICAGLILISTIPQFIYYYQAIWMKFKNREFYQNIRKSVDWINLKSTFFYAVIFGLEAIKFKDRKAKNLLPRRGYGYQFLLIPFIIQIFSISFIEVIDKKMLTTSIVADGAMLLIEAKLTNEGLIPFWLFNLRYQVHLFDIFYMTMLYFSLKHLRNDIDTKPIKYIEEIEMNDATGLKN